MTPTNNHSSTSGNNLANKALAILAYHFYYEMSYARYPQEWSRAPLRTLVPLLVHILDAHPDRLGTIIYEAYNKTFPEVFEGNLNQLPLRHERYFGLSRDRYIEEYEVKKNITYRSNYNYDIKVNVGDLTDLYREIIHVYASLEPGEENQHRTLEEIISHLHRLFYLKPEVRELGFNLEEYKDYWRTMPVGERQSYANKLLDGFNGRA